MADLSESNYRAWLGLELAEPERGALATWLREVCDPGAVSVPDGPQLIVLVAALAGRSRQGLASLAQNLPRLDPEPVRVEFGLGLCALPSRRSPRVYLLPVQCHGLAAPLRRLASSLPPHSGPVRPGRVGPFILAGRVKARPQTPVRWPRHLPARLRGPVDAVRLGLYCSRITPEHHRLDALAQVELPMAAAVR